MTRAALVGFILVLFTISGCVTVAEDAPLSDPKRAQIHVELGINYLKHQQFEVARNEFDLAIAIDNKLDSAYHGKGLLMARTGYSSEASAMFERALTLNPSNFMAINDYSIHRCQTEGVDVNGPDNGSGNGSDSGLARIPSQSDLGHVLHRLESTLKRPDNDKIRFTRLALGICHHQMNNRVQSKSYLGLVLADEKSLPQALLPMAEIHYFERDYLSARGFIERYFSTGSMSPRSLLLATHIELGLKDKDRAAGYRMALTTTFPDTEEAKKASLIKLI